MTAALSNTTRDLCAICLFKYGKNEINDVDKTIQLVCGHIFHTACAARNAGFREAGRGRKGVAIAIKQMLRKLEKATFFLAKKST